MGKHREAERWEVRGMDELEYWKLEADARKDKEHQNNKEVESCKP